MYFKIVILKLFKQILGGSLNNTNFTYSDSLPFQNYIFLEIVLGTVFKIANEN